MFNLNRINGNTFNLCIFEDFCLCPSRDHPLPTTPVAQTICCPLTPILPPPRVTEPLVFSKAQRIQNEDSACQPPL